MVRFGSAGDCCAWGPTSSGTLPELLPPLSSSSFFPFSPFSLFELRDGRADDGRARGKCRRLAPVEDDGAADLVDGMERAGAGEGVGCRLVRAREEKPRAADGKAADATADVEGGSGVLARGARRLQAAREGPGKVEAQLAQGDAQAVDNLFFVCLLFQ